MVELYTIAPTVVISVGDSLGEYYSLDNCARLATRIVGMQSDSHAKTIAMEGLVAGAAELDAKFDWHWMALEGNDTALVEDQRDYLVDADAIAIKNVYLIDKTDPSNPRQVRLDHILWDQAAREFNSETSGKPTCWTIFNFNDSKSISILPAPDAESAANYEIRVEWYEETYVPPFNQGTIVIGDNGVNGPAPKQVCEGLISYAKGVLVQTFDPDKKTLWMWLFDQFKKKTAIAKGKENRIGAGPIQIMPVGIHKIRSGRVY